MLKKIRPVRYVIECDWCGERSDLYLEKQDAFDCAATDGFHKVKGTADKWICAGCLKEQEVETNG